MPQRAQDSPPDRLSQLASLARNRSYVAMWAGQTISWVGNSFHRISLLFLLMEGVPKASQHLPLLFLMLTHAAAHLTIGPFAGVFVDRWNRKTTMIIADLVRAALVLVIPFVTGHPALYLLSFLVTAASLFFEPARHSSLPNVVAAEELFLANSFLATSESCAELVGLVAGGLVVTALGYRFAFFFDSCSFLVSAAAIAAMTFMVVETRAGRLALPAQAREVVRELRDGLRYVGRRLDLRALLGLYFVMAISLGSINYLLAAYAKTGLGMGPEAYALIDGGIVAGYVLGSVAVSLVGSGRNRVAMIGLGLLGMGAGTVVMAGTPQLALSVAGGVLGGLFNPIYYVASRTYMQESVPNEVLGRVFSLQFVVLQVGFLVSVALAVVALPWLGLRRWLVACGMILALTGLVAPRVGVLGKLRRGEVVAGA